MNKSVRQRSAVEKAQRKAQQRYRERDEAMQVCQVNVRVPNKWSDSVKKLARLMREGCSPGVAFMQAFDSRARTGSLNGAAAAQGDANGISGGE